jgi:hypothetical protein
MKTLKETFVIVESYGSLYEFFSDVVSFDRTIMEDKCIDMNKKFNDNLRATFRKSKSKKPQPPFNDIVKYSVMSLSEAIDKYHSNCHDMYAEEDESI